MDQAFLGFILPVASIVPVTVFDLKYRIIPDWLTLPLLTAGLAFSCAPQGITPYLALAGVFCGGGTLWAIEWIGRHVTGKEGMGGGGGVPTEPGSTTTGKLVTVMFQLQ